MFRSASSVIDTFWKQKVSYYRRPCLETLEEVRRARRCVFIIHASFGGGKKTDQYFVFPRMLI